MESKISRNLDENIRYIKELFKNCDDVVQRIFNVGGTNNQKIFMIYTDNIVDGDTIADFIMTNVMERYDGNGGLETLMNKAIAVGELEKQCDMEKIYFSLPTVPACHCQIFHLYLFYPIFL